MLQRDFTYLDHGAGLTVELGVISILCHTAGRMCKAAAVSNSMTCLCSRAGKGLAHTEGVSTPSRALTTDLELIP